MDLDDASYAILSEAADPKLPMKPEIRRTIFIVVGAGLAVLIFLVYKFWKRRRTARQAELVEDDVPAPKTLDPNTDTTDLVERRLLLKMRDL